MNLWTFHLHHAAPSVRRSSTAVNHMREIRSRSHPHAGARSHARVRSRHSVTDY